MNTKDVLLVGAGVVVGYLLVGFMNKSKDNAQGGMDSEQYPSANPPATTNPKIDACNKEVADFMATARYAQGVDLEAMKKAKFDACMARTS